MNPTRQAGFVITLEFLLVMALFVVPILIGAILLGRKLYTLYLNQREFIEQPYSRAVVWDSTGAPSADPACPGPDCPKVIGPVIGYDQFEAPLVIFRDDSNKAGVVLGVRRDRFTSYGEVFYTDSACTMNPRIRSWSASVATGFLPGGLPLIRVFVDPVASYPPPGFAYQMQGISYAMGNGNILYRSTDTPGSSVTSLLPPLYVWKSQDVTPEDSTTLLLGVTPPCFLVPATTEVTDLVDATPVIDFDSVYTAPYRLAFPSPTPGPGLAPPYDTGEGP